MSRCFEVTQDETVYRTITWRIEADSFEEAEHLVNEGFGEWYDSNEWDSMYGDVTEVECRECGATDESDCDCERADSHAFMSSLGL